MEQQKEITPAMLSEMQQSLAPGNVILLKFSADWCAPCKKIAPICQEYIPKLPNTIFTFQIDIDDSLELYATLKKHKMVNGVPAMLAYFSGEKEHWYIANDAYLDHKPDGAIAFFERCIAHTKMYSKN